MVPTLIHGLPYQPAVDAQVRHGLAAGLSEKFVEQSVRVAANSLAPYAHLAPTLVAHAPASRFCAPAAVLSGAQQAAISNLAASARLQPRSSSVGGASGSGGGASGSGAGQAPGNLRPKQKMGSSTDTTKPESLLPKLSWFSTNATADRHGVVGVSEGRGGGRQPRRRP